jgi:DNA repair exonuclease SbcCD ATPase subunit
MLTDIEINNNEIEKIKTRIKNVNDAVNGIYYNLNALTELVKEMLISIEKTNSDILNLEDENIRISEQLKIASSNKDCLENVGNKEKRPLRKTPLDKFSSEDLDELMDQDNEQINTNEYGDHINLRNLLYSDNSDPKDFDN